MTFATRLCAFTVLALAGVIAWHWHTTTHNAHEMTQLAVQQFHSDGALSERLQQGSLAQNWWPLVWPALIVALGIVMFWDDVERWWKQEQV